MSVLDDWQAQRRAKTTTGTELDRLQASTQTIQDGISNPGLWLLLVAGLVAAPFTLGAGFLLTIYAAVKMSGGKHMVSDAKPGMADVAAPGWAFLRIISALIGLLSLIVTMTFVAMLVMFEMGVIG